MVSLPSTGKKRSFCRNPIFTLLKNFIFLSYVKCACRRLSILYHCITKKKVSCEEEQLVHSDCWGSIKQPYVGGISSSIRRGEFSTLKVRDSCYFCVIFPFVIISTKVFETYTNWEKPLELFSEFFVRTLLRERDFLLGKRDFATFWSYKTRDSGPLRARNTMFNNSIDRSKSEEHLEFFSEVFLITLVQKQSL